MEKEIDDKIIEFNTNLTDDLNMSGTTGNIFELIHICNKNITKINIKIQDKIISFFKKANEIYAVFEIKKNSEKIDISEEDKKLIEKRNTARKNKDFKTADEIRDYFLDKRYKLIDKLDDTLLLKI